MARMHQNPKVCSHHKNRLRAFTLAEMAVVLVIAGLSAGLFMKINTATNAADCVVTTRAQLETIQKAINAYVLNNERYPLPAKRGLGVSNPKYGHEVSSASQVDQYSTKVAIGALPFQELGLSPAFAGDCWGNKFTYFVTEDLTAPGNYQDPAHDGQIEVAASNTGAAKVSDAAYAVISHGANGTGGVANNYVGGSKIVANVTTLEMGNYNRSDARVIDAPYNGSSDPTKSFDDLVLYSGKKLVSVDGECGSANGGSPTNIPPNTNLCNKGDTTPVTRPTYNWEWKCKGSNGGTDDNCQVPYSGGGTPCNLPWGGNIPDGSSVDAYDVANAADCSTHKITRNCNNGTLGGNPSYQYGSCGSLGSCNLPWGGTISDGQSVDAYDTTSAADCSTHKITRNCSGGTLSGGASYQYQNCAPLSSCSLPWGGTISDGQSVDAYKNTTAPDCNVAGEKETRTCNNGTLSGSFTNQSCSNASPPVCGGVWSNGGVKCRSGTYSPDADCPSVCHEIGPWIGWYFSWYCTNGAQSIRCTDSRLVYCFLEDTLVTMADGSKKPIRDLKPGDKVRGHTRVNHVLKVPSHETPQTVYGFNGGEAFVTGGHPFYTKQGWKAIDPGLTPTEGHTVKVTKLAVGDKLLLETGKPFTVKSIDAHETGNNTVYSPAVDGDHTYYANELLVHNKPLEGTQDCQQCQ